MTERRSRFATWALALTLGAAILTVGVLATNPSLTTTAHTEFYLPGVGDNATTSPNTFSPGTTTSFAVGISNHEHSAITYRVTATLSETGTTERSVRIDNGETRELQIPVTTPAEPGRYRIQFRLYYGDGDDPDLTTWYWIRVET